MRVSATPNASSAIRILLLGTLLGAVLGAVLTGCALPPTAGAPTSPSASVALSSNSPSSTPGSTPSSPAPASSAQLSPSSNNTEPQDPAVSGSAPVAGQGIVDNGQPAHIPTPEQIRAPIPGAPDRVSAHAQAAGILQTVPEATSKIALSVFNEWVTNKSKSFFGIDDRRTYRSSFTTMENNDGTLTNARCAVEMPGSMPDTSPEDWPALFDVCTGLSYQNADPATVTAWAKDALRQLQTTSPGPEPVFQMTDLNCLHWQVGWASEVFDANEFLGQVAIDVSTGFSPLTPGGGYDGTAPDHPTAYGCPG